MLGSLLSTSFGLFMEILPNFDQLWFLFEYIVKFLGDLAAKLNHRALLLKKGEVFSGHSLTKRYLIFCDRR